MQSEGESSKNSPTREEKVLVELQAAYVDRLNRGGIPFQLTVAAKQLELERAGATKWATEAYEFPVEIRGRPFHIDLVLKHRTVERYAVIECKRVQPKFAAWMFAPSLGGTAELTSPNDFVEQLQSHKGVPTKSIAVERSNGAWCTKAVAGVEPKLRTVDGESHAQAHAGRGAIGDAEDQVLRGLNGLVNHLLPSLRLRGYTSNVEIVPIIVTTAELYMCDAEVCSASMLNGNIPASLYGVRPVPYLSVNVPQSPGIKHDWGLMRNNDPTVSSNWLRFASDMPQVAVKQVHTYDYVRTVYVARATALAQLLDNVG